jgi:hypothetical protein
MAKIISTQDSFDMTQKLLDSNWIISDTTDFNGSYAVELCSPRGERVDVFLSKDEFNHLDFTPMWR